MEHNHHAENAQISALVVEPGKRPYVKSISPDLASLQQEVGEPIQVIYPWEDPCVIICDDEGKLKNKPLNRALRDADGNIYDVIVGTFIIVGLGEEDFSSLDSRYIQKYCSLFDRPEMFIRDRKSIIVV